MSDPEQPGRPEGGPERRIEQALARLGADLEPPAGWEARVLAATRSRRRPWWMYAVPGLAVAIAAVCAVAFLPPRHALAFSLDVELTHGGKLRGNDVRRDGVAPDAEASPGDVARIAVSGGDGARAIWVYREERELVLRCPAGPTCQARDGALRAELTFPLVGTYKIVTSAGRRLPEPTGRYDDDTAALRDAGVTDIREYTVRVE